MTHRVAACATALGPAAVLVLGVLLTAPEIDGCAACGDVPPFVAARTEILIYDPPPPVPPQTRNE